MQTAGLRSYVTVLFCDLCGSTGLAAEVDADSYAELLEAIRAEGSRIVTLFGGDVAQVYGDGMLSIFQGATAAAQAVEAALMLHRTVSVFAPPEGSRMKSLKLHSGIHSGLALLRPGDAARGAIEAIGRTTSVAARLSAAAGPDEILVSAGSLGPAREAFSLGKARKVEIGDGSEPMLALPVLLDKAEQTDAFLTANRQFPFVGRRGEIAAFAEQLDGLRRGEPFRTVITAPAGQGKSRLSREVEAMAADMGISLLRGICSSATAVGPLQPFRQIVTALNRGEEMAEAPDSEALPALLGAWLRQRPVLLVLDDWQWADTASTAMLARIRDIAGPLGILLLTRLADFPEFSHADYRMIQLPPLDREETAVLVRSRRPELDPIDAARVHARAGGNPLYAEELCLLNAHTARTLLPDGSEPVGSGWVASLVASRVRQLPGPAQQVLEIAAVIGMTPPRWLLDAVAGAKAVTAAMPILLAQDFLVQEPNSRSASFKHGISWEIVYSLIPLGSRRRLHADIAAALEAHDSTPGIDLHEALAWHYRASNQPEKCWMEAERAGDQARSVASLDRAQVHYRLALETLASLPDMARDYPRYAALVGKFGYVCIYDSDAAHIPLFLEAIRRAELMENRAAQADAEYWLGYVAHGSGDVKLAIRHCALALSLSDLADDSAFKVQVRATLGQSLAITSRYADAAPLLDDAIAVKRSHRSGRGASAGMAYTLTQRAAIWADMGHFTQAHVLMHEAVGLLGGQPHPVEASIMAWNSAICAWQGEWERLIEVATRGSDIAQRIEAIYIHAICRAFACYGRWKLDGDCASADGLAAAVACLVDRGKAMALSIACGFLADVEVARGNGEGARRAVGYCFARTRAGDLLGLGWAARAWASQLSTHDPDRARIFMDRARANARQRASPHEMARCDLEAARLGLVSGAERTAALARAASAFGGMGMSRLAAEAALLA